MILTWDFLFFIFGWECKRIQDAIILHCLNSQLTFLTNSKQDDFPKGRTVVFKPGSNPAHSGG